MGLEHRRHVDAIPPGWVTLAERFVLFILADETNDSRTAWGHDLEHIRVRLGGVSESWLSRRLKSLQKARYISRMKQRRNPETGRFYRQLTSLTGLHYGPGYYDPTAAAEADHSLAWARSQQLRQSRPSDQRRNPETGRFHPHQDPTVDHRRPVADGVQDEPQNAPGRQPPAAGHRRPPTAGPTVNHRRSTWTEEEPGQKNPDGRSDSVAAAEDSEAEVFDLSKILSGKQSLDDFTDVGAAG